MRQDQLQKARQARWRQDGNALLTLDDAERWLAETALCLYLPRHQHLPVPAPSFVEAIAGRPDPTPAPAQIAAASQMLARLVASGAAIALNLFGTGPSGFGSASGIVGEQPDFLVTPEALPYLYALQPQRNPKRQPTTTGAARVSPLAAEVFQLLTRDGALTAIELRERLGREVTEAATLRALGELWHALRVVPVPDEHGAPAHWELLVTRHGRELNIGSTQSQTTALSVLVSFYLQSAVAATDEEADVFLSPLAPRSRIREVIHGLSATRQLASFSLNGAAQLYVEGTLPELPEEEETTALAADVVTSADLDAGLEQNEPSFPEAAARKPREAAARKPTDRRASFSDRARSRSTSHDSGQRDERRPFRRESGGRPPQRRSFGERAPRADRGERRPFDRAGGARPPQRRSFGDREPTPRADRGERRPFDRRDRPERPGQKRSQAGFERPRGEGRPPREPRFEKRSFSRGEDFRKQRPGAQRPFRRRDDEQPGARRPSSGEGERRPFRREGERPAFGGAKDRRPFAAGGERRPFRKSPQDRPFSKDRPYRKDQEGRPARQDRPQGAFRKDRPARPFDRDRQDRPFRKPAGDRSPRGEKPSRPTNRPWTDRPPRSGDRERGRGFSSRPQDGERRPFRRDGDRPERGSFQKPASRERSYSKPGDRPRSGGFRPRSKDGEAGAPSQFRKPAGGNRSFGKPRSFGAGKPAGRPTGKGPFRPGKPGGGKRFGSSGPSGPRGGKRPGGSAPPRRKPRNESREGDEG